MMRRLLKIELSWAVSRAFTKFGIAIAANKPMMATTIMISTRVKPAVLFVLICITLLSAFLFRGVNNAKGGVLLLLNLFTNCLLQPRSWNLAIGMPQSVSTKTRPIVRNLPRILLGLSQIMPKVSRRWLQNGHNTSLRSLDDSSLANRVHESFPGRARCPNPAQLGFCILEVGSWKLEVGSWMFNVGCWMHTL